MDVFFLFGIHLATIYDAVQHGGENLGDHSNASFNFATVCHFHEFLCTRITLYISFETLQYVDVYIYIYISLIRVLNRNDAIGDE